MQTTNGRNLRENGLTEAPASSVMTASETAAYLRISLKTLYQRAGTGEIPGRKIGSDWRFNRGAIDDYLAMISQ